MEIKIKDEKEKDTVELYFERDGNNVKVMSLLNGHTQIEARFKPDGRKNLDTYSDHFSIY